MIRIFGKRKCSKPEKGIRSVDLIEYDPERREKKVYKALECGQRCSDKNKAERSKKEGDRWPVRLICDMRPYVKMIFQRTL